jgi:hypothetical protein
MNKALTTANLLLVSGLFAVTACTTQEEMTAKSAPAAPAAATAKAAPAKAKVERASGDIGLIDTEKNYMILVTKQGKLITLDFDGKTKVTKITPRPGKVQDIGLGSSASVEYLKKGDDFMASKLDYRVKGGRD